MRLAATLLVLILAGCGTAVPSGTPVSPATRPPSTGATPSLPSASSGPVAIDPSLLDHLPPTVDGLEVMRSAELDAVAAADPAVVANGDSVAGAIVAAPGTGDLATATLVKLRAGAFSEELYRSWRDSFDEGVCERAGGVVRKAEASIAGRKTYIGTCTEGVRTYHVWLATSRILVSVSSLGDRRLGELVIEALRD